MTDKEVIEIVNSEFGNPQFDITKQYLSVHQPINENGILKIERIDRENPEVVTAYIPVHDEDYFYFKLVINRKDKSHNGIHTEPANVLRLISNSREVTVEEMKSFLKLQTTKSRDKGKNRYKRIEIEPNPEPDAFEDKFHKLIPHLLQDKEGIQKLASCTDTAVSFVVDFHYKSSSVGRIRISADMIKAMHELNVDVDFDITAWGNPLNMNIRHHDR